MSPAARNGLVIGFFLGLYTVWNAWPEGAALTDTRITRAMAQMLGAMALCWFIGRLVGRPRSK